MKDQLKKYREWQKRNREWELLCDIEDVDLLYTQWHELPKKERMSWIGRFREDPKGAWQEFGTARCKYEEKCLAPDLNLYNPLDWPEGFCMLVIRTGRVEVQP